MKQVGCEGGKAKHSSRDQPLSQKKASKGTLSLGSTEEERSNPGLSFLLNSDQTQQLCFIRRSCMFEVWFQIKKKQHGAEMPAVWSKHKNKQKKADFFL